ncbi:hypothetical protein [Mesorhizobium sp.]|uniref:hypothetical protein n=1 Tax=Mesorhizobium sp. TaxID=1871066 RepID=UPI0025B8C9B6|nr:hypothetical protein [Mesorhizobium sp.]
MPPSNIPPIVVLRKPLAEAVHEAAECAIRKGRRVKAIGGEDGDPHRRICAGDGDVQSAFAAKKNSYRSQGSLAEASRWQFEQIGAVLLAALDIADDVKPSGDIGPLEPTARVDGKVAGQYIPDGLTANVILSAGEYETGKFAPFQIGADDEQKRLEQKKPTRTDEFVRAMAERLDALPGVRASFELHAGENYMSILPVTVNQAVQAAFAVRLGKHELLDLVNAKTHSAQK